mmetsp:Transcript_25500/g.66745  ORF Transcript_25500/g.66745 Transcript_25500/m.66745 type:complete len:201 (-) Transcript_25500:2991-3593(-)
MFLLPRKCWSVATSVGDVRTPVSVMPAVPGNGCVGLSPISKMPHTRIRSAMTWRFVVDVVSLCKSPPNFKRPTTTNLPSRGGFTSTITNIPCGISTCSPSTGATPVGVTVIVLISADLRWISIHVAGSLQYRAAGHVNGMSPGSPHMLGAHWRACTDSFSGSAVSLVTVKGFKARCHSPLVPVVRSESSSRRIKAEPKAS